MGFAGLADGYKFVVESMPQLLRPIEKNFSMERQATLFTRILDFQG
jgi:hypothetical protein